MIAWSVYSSFQIFTGKKYVPEIFSLPESTDPLTESGELDQEIQQVIKEQIMSLFPPEFLTNLFNLIMWSVFAGILIFAGYQISSLGIKLLNVKDPRIEDDWTKFTKDFTG